jgi:hypothetical protein
MLDQPHHQFTALLGNFAELPARSRPTMGRVEPSPKQGR